MMAQIVGNRFKVYIEDQQGRVMEVPAIAASVSMNMEYGDFIRTRIELDAIGDVTWTSTDNWRGSIREKSIAPEWKCDYCGRPNQRKDEICKSCGAVRSFIYGVGQ